MKKILDILIQIGLIIWQLPQVLVALIMMPFLGKLRLVEYRDYCWAFEGENMNGGISLGCFIFLSKYSAKSKTTIAHEFGHVKDSQKFSWLYLFVIGLPSICWAAFKPKSKCYYSFYTERLANKHAGLGVDTLCRLYLLDKEDYKKREK